MSCDNEASCYLMVQGVFTLVAGKRKTPPQERRQIQKRMQPQKRKHKYKTENTTGQPKSDLPQNIKLLSIGNEIQIRNT